MADYLCCNSSSLSPLSSVTGHMTSMAASTKDSHNFQWYSVVLPVTTSFGVFGNLITLLVLTRRRISVGVHSSSRPANRGLVALAVSDLLFCISVLPFSFITDMSPTVPGSQKIRLYYRIYGTACIHLFLMVSTYLVLVTALMRFIAVSQPLHARRHFLLRFSRGVIFGVYLLSTLLTLPYFLLFRVVEYRKPSIVANTTLTVNSTLTSEMTTASSFFTDDDNTPTMSTMNVASYSNKSALFVVAAPLFSKNYTHYLKVRIT